MTALCTPMAVPATASSPYPGDQSIFVVDVPHEQRIKAVVYTGTRSVTVQDVPDAELEEPTDVVVRVTSSAICGTDLHMYDGRTGAEPGLVFGHEPLGVIERAGTRGGDGRARGTGW